MAHRPGWNPCDGTSTALQPMRWHIDRLRAPGSRPAMARRLAAAVRNEVARALMTARVGLGHGQECLVRLGIADRDAGALVTERPDADPRGRALGREVAGVRAQAQ